jgi:hypothetical protein
VTLFCATAVFVVDVVDVADATVELLVLELMVLEQLNVALVPSNSTDWGECVREDLREAPGSGSVLVVILVEAVLKGLEHMVILGNADSLLLVACCYRYRYRYCVVLGEIHEERSLLINRYCIAVAVVLLSSFDFEEHNSLPNSHRNLVDSLAFGFQDGM